MYSRYAKAGIFKLMRYARMFCAEKACTPVIICLHFVLEQVKLLPIVIQNVNLIYRCSVDVLLLYRR